MKKLKAAMSRVLQIPEARVTKDLTREGAAGWDSFANLLLFSELETAFGVKFTMEEISGAKGVKDILGYLKRKGVRAS